tara:strand:+ start:2285 stop:2407 length:123 start_codon:yes stop_codon:yes gene_type:complete
MKGYLEGTDARFTFMQQRFWMHSRGNPKADFVEYVIKYAP